MRPYRRVAAIMALGLTLLIANLSWLQVLGADAIRSHPDNNRSLLEQYNRARGPIVVNGTPIATSTRAKSDSFFQRSYVDGPLYAAVTGYYSLLYGASGIERSENDVLSGTDSRFFVDRVQQLFAGQHQAGGAVTLTIDTTEQRAAYKALGTSTGAIVIMDAKLGAIRAMVSKPTYDPQELAPNDPVTVRGAYKRLATDATQPLLNRATGKTYPVGDMFHLVTTAAALATGSFTMTTQVACNDEPMTLQVALERHCDDAFRAIGAQIGMGALRSTAEQFGFNVAFPVLVPSAASTFPASGDVRSVASGQGVTATVLQMALVAATLANKGSLMTPYLVSDVRTPSLVIVEAARPTSFGAPIAVRNADALSGALAVRPDTGIRVFQGTSTPAWAIAFSGRAAVAVCIESSGSKAQGVALAALRAVSVKQ